MDSLDVGVEVRKSALIERSAAAMFDLIEAAERYPEFMPWCSAATVLQRDDSVVVARLSVDYHGAVFSFTTRNAKRRPHWMSIALEEGPFARFEGEWRIAALAPEACRIELDLLYDFGGSLLSHLAAPLFDSIGDTMVDAFARRATQNR